MKFNMKLKMNDINKIIKDHGLDANGSVSNFLRNEVDRLSDSYVPMNTGVLKNTKTYPSNHEIRYTSPYARYQYYGKSHSGQPLKYQGAPKRGDHWEQRMLNDKKNELVKNVQSYIKSGEGSKNNGRGRNKVSVINEAKSIIKTVKRLKQEPKLQKPKFVRKVDKYSKKIGDFGKNKR